MSPFLELRAQDEVLGPSGTKPAAGGRPTGLTQAPDLDLSTELKQIREASPLVDSMRDSPFKSFVRLVVRSFWLQLSLFVVVSVAAVLAPLIAGKAMGVRLEPGAFAYFMYFVLATLFFTRHRYKESFAALFIIVSLSVLLHLLHLYPGFKPTAYFWLTVLLVGVVNAFYYNDYTVTIAEQNLELRALRRELMATDRLMGKVSAKGGADEMAYVKQAQEEVARNRAHYTSLIANLMQFGGGGPESERGRQGAGSAFNYAAITRACWQILKRGVGATRAEILFFDAGRNLLYTVKAFVSAETAAEGPFGLSATPSEEIPAEKAKMALSLDKDSLFKYCVANRKAILRNDIDREGPLKDLEAKTPCPVHSLVPLLDGETVLGVINLSECPKKELSDEDRTILRTTSRLAAMALAHAQTFLQTKEELEQAKVLSVEERKKRAEVMKVFKTLVSANIVEEILNDPSVMNPKRQRITIIFVDLRGFTTLSERLDAAMVVELLDDFFETLTPLIFKYNGTLDKYIGDEIMALWGAPVTKPDDTSNAILCSVEMMNAMESVKTRWKKRGLDVAMGIAINTGEAIVGSIGSTANKNFTAIGDAVNTAARLEGLSERNQILMTRTTYDEVREIVKVRQMPSAKVKGKEQELEIYEVMGLKLQDGQEVLLPHAGERGLASPDGSPPPSAEPPRPPAPRSAAESRPAAPPSAARPAPPQLRSQSGVVRAAAGPPAAEPARARSGSQPGPAVSTGATGSKMPAASVARPVQQPLASGSRVPVVRPVAPSEALGGNGPDGSAGQDNLEVTIGSSRELASRASGGARVASPLDDGSAPSSRDLAARASGRNTLSQPGPVPRPAESEGGPAAESIACPQCRHVNRVPGLKRCDKCGETLPRS
ncbi:MAG: GAF domain-containing protein [Candidatus Riflebacteria bacterium]|nr:GAF domain-containing protein [Candidatus Riflebacteria bacterium]